MDIEIAVTASDALGTLEQELDREFVTGRGRHGTLRARYPLAFSTDGHTEFVVARRGFRALACLAARHFVWHTQARAWNGVMIGLVFTAGDFRGRSLGTRLMRSALERFESRGSDFAVLWSRIEGFYEAFGFRRADRGVLGRLIPAAIPDCPPPGSLTADLPAEDLFALERLRRTCVSGSIDRPAEAWGTIPLPADCVRVLRSGTSRDPGAYLLFGTLGRTRLVYEIAGDPHIYEPLWAALLPGASEILVNDVRNSPSMRWLETSAEISWQNQNLALWAPLTPAARDLDFSDWYVPYFDRF